MAKPHTAQSVTAVSEPCVAPRRWHPQAVGEAPRLHRRRRPDASATDLAAVARERAVQSRRAQGLPDHITDAATLDQVAQLVLADRSPTWAARPPP
jgi:hypothetical protein